jgi:RND family efflux transporter MFP subunit
MRKRTKIVIWVAVAVAVVAVFAATAERRLRKEKYESIADVQSAEGIPVDYVVARISPVEDWRRFVGTAEGFDQIDLTADYRTRVSGVHARVGDVVPKGKVIVSLDEYDPATIAANLETAGAQYRTARRDSLRMEDLFASGAISEQDLDHVRAQTDAARATYNMALRAVRLDSPIGGVVTALYVERGDYADSGQILATVSSFDRVRIRLDVSDADRRVIRVGQPVRLALSPETGSAAPGSGSPVSLKGTVSKASLSADPDTRLFRVDLILDNREHLLKPGSLVTPQIRVAAAEAGPAVPKVAVIERGGGSAVYVVTGRDGDRRAELREVVPGPSGDGLMAIESGVASGDLVVVWGQTKLTEGVKVALHKDVTSEYFAGADSEGGSR